MNDTEKQQYRECYSQELKDAVTSGQGIYYSLCKSLDGYVNIPNVLRSWSYNELAKIPDNCHTHIFVGEHDVQTPANGARYIHNHLSNSKLTVYPNGGHMTIVFCFDKILREFASSTAAATC